MQTDSSLSPRTSRVGAVAALWRYPVKSMMGEALNCSEVSDRGLLGDRRFAVVDPATGKVGGAKNPRKWGNFFDFRAAYTEPPHAGAATTIAVRPPGASAGASWTVWRLFCLRAGSCSAGRV